MGQETNININRLIKLMSGEVMRREGQAERRTEKSGRGSTTVLTEWRVRPHS